MSPQRRPRRSIDARDAIPVGAARMFTRSPTRRRAVGMSQRSPA